ncbi:Squalene epoxidase [Pleurotus pulmonarius]|nr:Squalene epoxidase [Pleurotus pulmonarius]
MRTDVPADHYDVVIIGAGIAGSALAYALSSNSTDTTHKYGLKARELRVALVERSLSKPDRIVGELLQPGGILALRELGLDDCIEGIDAIPVHGYCVVEGERQVRVPYPDGFEGRSFHHGEFVMALRKKAIGAVDVVEAVVTELIEESASGKIVGVRYRAKDGIDAISTHELRASVVIVADGSASKFRKQVLQPAYATKVEPRTVSHFIGLILEDAKLPIAQHGTVVFIKGHGPVLLYQISEGCTRMLIDVKEPLPVDMKVCPLNAYKVTSKATNRRQSHILTEIIPQLPPSLRLPATRAVQFDRLRRMPCPFLTAISQHARHTKPGAILLGDAWNMRHPLTGGGMTVALNDVVLLRDILRKIDDLDDWQGMQAGLTRWYWERKLQSSTINMLSLVLYEMFGAADEELSIMRLGCFEYFELGGEYVRGTISLLAGISSSPFQLFRHFFGVAICAIWVLFTSRNDHQSLLIKSIWKTCVIFFPLLWDEIRWWIPSQSGDQFYSCSMSKVPRNERCAHSPAGVGALHSSSKSVLPDIKFHAVWILYQRSTNPVSLSSRKHSTYTAIEVCLVESGVYYVVPDKRSGAKKLVRRHPPPLTTAPLDDDFDAVTQTQAYTVITPTIERVENESYYSHYGYDRDGQTSVPLDDDFDAVTYEPLTTVREEWREDHHDGQYDGFAEPVSPSQGGWPATGLGGKWAGRSRTTSEIQRRPLPSPIGTSKSLLPNTAVSKPSRLGEQFEMVRRKIIEDSPQKTVTISMWRENVADEAGGEVGMSVYYVNPDDYAVEEGGDARREEVVTEHDNWAGRRIYDDARVRGRAQSISMDRQSVASYGAVDHYRHGSPLRKDMYPNRTSTSTPTNNSSGSPPHLGRFRESPTSSNTTYSNPRPRGGSGSSTRGGRELEVRNKSMSLAARNILASSRRRKRTAEDDSHRGPKDSKRTKLKKGRGSTPGSPGASTSTRQNPQRKSR